MTVSFDAIGFVGLGRMGVPMTERLVQAGYQVLVFDSAGTRQRLPRGAEPASSISELAASTDTMFLSVPAGANAKDVCHQIATTAERRVGTVIELSTVGISSARECARLLESHGITYIDAPVSGGVAGATGGTLTMMVGATVSDFEQADPALSELASNRFRVGDSAGQGQAMKLVNNFASAAALAATAEATVFGARMGLDLETMVNVMRSSSGRSAAVEDKFPKSIVPGTYDFGFAGAMMTKDVDLYLESAAEADMANDLARAIASVWQRFHESHPDADFTYIHKYFEEGGQ